MLAIPAALMTYVTEQQRTAGDLGGEMEQIANETNETNAPITLKESILVLNWCIASVQEVTDGYSLLNLDPSTAYLLDPVLAMWVK